MEQNTKLDELETLLEQRNYKDMRPVLEEMAPVDIAEFLDEVPSNQLMPVFRLLGKKEAADVFSYFEPETQERLIGSITDREIAQIIEEMSLDDAVDLVGELPANVVKRVLRNASNETRSLINQFLNYSDNTIGSIMTAEFTELHAAMSVGDAIAYIRKNGEDRETVYTCYIISKTRRLAGVVTVKDLLRARDEEAVSEIMDTNVVKAVTTDDKEEAIQLMSKYDLLSLPVVDRENRLVGIVTIDDVVDVMEEEATRDIEQMAAMQPLETTYLKTSVLTIVKKRIGWLLILMVAGMINGAILGNYEAAFAALPLLVTFVPMLTDTGGNSGSQSSTTVIRGLTTGEIELADWLRVFWKELRVSLVVGIIFGSVNFLRVLLFNPGQVMVALTVSLAMMATIIIAKSLGAVLPILAKRMGLDPAVMAAPLITTTVDACSLIIYFSLAQILLL